MIGANWIVGVVGQLQLEVLISRLGAEYNVNAGFEPSPWETARWIAADDEAKLKAFIEEKRSAIAEDRDGAPVFMAKDTWELNYTSGRNPRSEEHTSEIMSLMRIKYHVYCLKKKTNN